MASREGPRTGHPRSLTFQEGFLEEESTRRQKQGLPASRALRAAQHGLSGPNQEGWGELFFLGMETLEALHEKT